MRRNVCHLALMGMLFSHCAGAASRQSLTSGGPLNLVLRTADGRWVDSDDFSGSQRLFVLIASFDNTSQLALRELESLARRQPDVVFGAVLVQPDARQVLPVFESTMALPFPVYRLAERDSLSQFNPLSVPMYIHMDGAGRLLRAERGMQQTSSIERWLRSE